MHSCLLSFGVPCGSACPPSLCITCADSYKPDDLCADSDVEVTEAAHTIKQTDDRGGVDFEFNSNPYERRFTPYVWLPSCLPNTVT